MKRAHGSSLVPYQYRQAQPLPPTKRANKESQVIPISTKAVIAPDLLSILPNELIQQIFYFMNLTFSDLKSLAWTCKKFIKNIYSEEFKLNFLTIKELSLNFNVNDTWIKTYRQFLLTSTYVLLDRSPSMKHLEKKKSYEILNSVAMEVFKHNLWRGLNVIVFGASMEFFNLKSMQVLKYYIQFLEDDNNSDYDSNCLPELEKIYEMVNAQKPKNASKSIVHIISDCNVEDVNRIVNIIYRTPCFDPLHINFHHIGKLRGARVLVSQIDQLQSREHVRSKRASVSLIEHSEIPQKPN